jgi:3-hydroxyisobutyrate dehydrogenase-like beta-hydroxyacid dehydrogenase
VSHCTDPTHAYQKALALPDVEACATAREAVAGAPVVMSSLANDEAVCEVTFGPHAQDAAGLAT